MILKLNIYEKGKIAKTYTATQYDIMFGTVEDFLRIIDIDSLSSKQNISDYEFIKICMSALSSGIGELKNIFLDIFDGLTEEELRCTKVRELLPILTDLIKFSLDEIGLISSNGKN